MKRFLIIAIILFPFLSIAQMIDYGFMMGAGFGKPRGDGLEVKTGPNMEYGFMFKYNLMEKMSIRVFFDLEFHKYTLTKGRQVEDPDITPPVIIASTDYKFKSTAFVAHADYTYIAIEHRLDFSGGFYAGLNFVGRGEYHEPRIFYAADDAGITALADQPGLYNSHDGEDYKTSLYTSDQIRKGMKGPNAGLYVAATGGSEKLKLSLRYDMGLMNKYFRYSSTNKIKESYFRVGLIYFFNG